LARELGMALAPLAHARGIDLALEADLPMWVDGESTVLNELLCNLLDNALAPTSAGGNVILRVLPDAVLEVEDDAPRMPSMAHERVFARFYRCGNKGGSGAGVGDCG
jgi:two-component system, OmpR family, sensor histidine kinase TctE